MPELYIQPKPTQSAAYTTIDQIATSKIGFLVICETGTDLSDFAFAERLAGEASGEIIAVFSVAGGVNFEPVYKNRIFKKPAYYKLSGTFELLNAEQHVLFANWLNYQDAKAYTAVFITENDYRGFYAFDNAGKFNKASFAIAPTLPGQSTTGRHTSIAVEMSVFNLLSADCTDFMTGTYVVPEGTQWVLSSYSANWNITFATDPGCDVYKLASGYWQLIDENGTNVIADIGENSFLFTDPSKVTSITADQTVDGDVDLSIFDNITVISFNHGSITGMTFPDGPGVNVDDMYIDLTNSLFDIAVVADVIASLKLANGSASNTGRVIDLGIITVEVSPGTLADDIAFLEEHNWTVNYVTYQLYEAIINEAGSITPSFTQTAGESLILLTRSGITKPIAAWGNVVAAADVIAGYHTQPDQITKIILQSCKIVTFTASPLLMDAGQPAFYVDLRNNNITTMNGIDSGVDKEGNRLDLEAAFVDDATLATFISDLSLLGSTYNKNLYLGYTWQDTYYNDPTNLVAVALIDAEAANWFNDVIVLESSSIIS